MAKYKYNKKALKDLSVKPFLNEVATREAQIAKAVPYDIKADFNANKLAESLHPRTMTGYVKKIIEHTPDCKTLVIAPQDAYGYKSFPYFRAGQYVSIHLKMGASFVSRPYTLSSNPALALGDENNEYHITIKRKEGGLVSNYLLDNAFVRMELSLNAPLGEFYYSPIRDARHVIAVAGGSGITPFMSMAAAISTGIEDFNLTILYGSRSKKDILLKSELDEIVKASRGKVKVIHVLSDEETEFNTAPVHEKLFEINENDDTSGDDRLVFEKDGSEVSVDGQGNITEVDLNEVSIKDLDEGNIDPSIYEHGFITADLIRKYAPEGDYSIYACGPDAMYKFLRGEVKKLDIPARRVRFEVAGEFGDPTCSPDYPSGIEKDEFDLTVNVHSQKKTIKCKRNESLITAIERAGIRVTTDCRSGSCGWCHSRLISGDIYIPEGKDVRKMGDKKFGWIHPCITYPLSDIEMEVFPEM